MLLRKIASILVVVACGLPNASADWSNLTGAELAPVTAELYINEDHALLQLELSTDAYNALRPSGREIGGKPDWMAELITLQADNGSAVPGSVSVYQRKPATRRVHSPPSPKHASAGTAIDAQNPKPVHYAEIRYEFVTKPRSLRLVPPASKADDADFSIGMIAYHSGVPVIDFQFLKVPETLNLDWDDPWFTRFENKKLKRHHESPLMSFLYIEPFEVRHEILIRVRDLQQLLNLPSADQGLATALELEALKLRAGEFLSERETVRIDGRAVHPILDQTTFLRVDPDGLKTLENTGSLKVSTALLGVVFAYISNGIPESVTVDWSLFPGRIRQVPSTIYDPAGVFESYVTPEYTRIEWINELDQFDFTKNYQLPRIEAIPVEVANTVTGIPYVVLFLAAGFVLSVGLMLRKTSLIPTGYRPAVFILISIVAVDVIGLEWMKRADRSGYADPIMNGERATPLLHGLIKNIYRAFDFREESDVYDKLALSVSDELLETIYLQNRQALEIERSGGSRARVQEVDIVSVDIESASKIPPGFNSRVGWTATGSVSHWGHSHTRTNRYEARVATRVVDGVWKITGLELDDGQRVDPAPEERGASGGD